MGTHSHWGRERRGTNTEGERKWECERKTERHRDPRMNTHTEQDQEVAESEEFSGATIFGFLFQNTCSWKPSGTALCLSRALHAQHGVLPRPSIWAEPGPVIPWGQPVNIVCQGPAESATFRLEKKGTSSYKDEENPGQETQARFTIAKVDEDTAGLYHCRYHTYASWSEPSEDLKLEVTGDSQMQEEDSNSPSLSTEHVFILTGVSVALFLCVLLLALIFLYCWHQKKHRPLGCEGEEQRPQERVSPAIDMLERTPDPDSRRPLGRDLCSAGPAHPCTEDSPSRTPTVHGAHG
ncbi:leukocyte-associated immunoglobulin-like receptor 1 isoform X3 [Neovison vison]|uniref:leukocyte-associated immunoglobulin-like receptor 1 isoform X3 n=1 Tax=Neovison vison TaxID=452646 RepID=UPI001CF03A15|nr:leukocyte-associated immunoglobulin-like receptor 1 isoform X3 [Neogale vison]